MKELGSFVIPGETVQVSNLPDAYVSFGPNQHKVSVPQNGEFETGQMYVQFFMLSRPRVATPVLLWHGGGSTGAVWETTPDGRPGWVMNFLQAGYSVYLPDSVERGRSGFNRYPEIYHSAPLFRAKKEAWDVFRIGKYDADPAKRVVFPGQQFPADAFDNFFRINVPRWVDNDPAIQRAYDRLVEKVCPCVLVAHSQGGIYAIRSAASYPNLVKSLVLLEPSDVPSLDAAAMDNLTHVRQLLVWGDFIGQNKLWSYYQGKLRQYYQSLHGKGDVTWVDLPAQGITGNSHFMMMDRNSDAIAGLVRSWIEKSQGTGIASSNGINVDN